MVYENSELANDLYNHSKIENAVVSKEETPFEHLDNLVEKENKGMYNSLWDYIKEFVLPKLEEMNEMYRNAEAPSKVKEDLKSMADLLMGHMDFELMSNFVHKYRNITQILLSITNQYDMMVYVMVYEKLNDINFTGDIHQIPDLVSSVMFAIETETNTNHVGQSLRSKWCHYEPTNTTTPPVNIDELGRFIHEYYYNLQWLYWVFKLGNKRIATDRVCELNQFVIDKKLDQLHFTTEEVKYCSKIRSLVSYIKLFNKNAGLSVVSGKNVFTEFDFGELMALVRECMW